VRLGESGKAKISEVVEGDTVREVLGYVQYEPDELRRKFTKSIEAALQENQLTLDEARTLRRFYERGLNESTYLT
jgi:arginine decarboxylase